MAEKLVANLLDQLISVPARQLQNHIILVSGVKNEVANLSSKLTMIQRRLRDVERRRLTEKDVRDWHERLQDLAYEMDDVLDEWNTEIHKYRVEVAESLNASSSTFWDEVQSFFLTYCLCCKEASIRDKIARKIKELNGRMSLIYKEWEDFKFVESAQPQEFKPPPSTSDFDESELQGRGTDKDAVLNQLLYEDEDKIRIVSIVGTGGIGKTTLAQVVYNDNEVKDRFDLRKWVCVSDPFDQTRIAKAILETTEQRPPDASELETLVKGIKKLIARKRFLLVLDDVWTEDRDKWEPIWNSLRCGAPGSRILVTTRSKRVAQVIDTDYLHQLNELDDSDCWTILSRIAFSGRSEDECERLAEIGFEISKKCKGLPLAARFLGSLLQFKGGVEDWKEVWESEIWELKEASISLFPHLYLSYKELSPEMKRCFLYCAIFAKDSVIDVQELIRLWMAQGYLSSNGRVRQLALRGYECFNNLAMRSFFQNLERHEYYETRIVWCKMHDIVHDFAQYLTNGECLIIDQGLDVAKNLSCEKVRHLRWYPLGQPIGEDIAVSSVIGDVRKLRSFYHVGYNIVASGLFHRLECVRILSLRDSWLIEVPGCVGKLIHLRLLDLSGNPLEELPEEIGDLYNLETLDISDCRELIVLPQRIENLINLRYLLNLRTNDLKQLSRALEKLTSLQTLRKFRVGNGYDKFEDLKNLHQLVDAEIEFYEVDEVDFDGATLGDKARIQQLTFIFQDQQTNYASLIESLQAPPNLEFLSLSKYPNSNLPSWIMSLNNVRILEISLCKLTALPALGQLPSLEQLVIEFMSGIEVLGPEFMLGGAAAVRVPIFPKLKKLSLQNLWGLRIWEDLQEEDEDVVSAVMPCLRELRIDDCSKLEKLPHRLLRMAPSLKLLDLRFCRFLKERYSKNEGRDWIHISHIPNVFIHKEKQ